jgi:hypothetical protein
VELTKPPETPAAEPAAWISVPARVIALIVVLPVRLGYDLLRAIGRGLRAVCRPLWQGLAYLARVVWAGVSWVVRAVGRVLSLLLVRPALWFARVVLTPLGRAVAWTFRLVIWRPLRLLLSGVAWVLTYVLVVPAEALWRYVLSPLLRTVSRRLAALARGVWAVLAAIVHGVAAAFDAAERLLRLVYRKVVVELIWRYALRPVWLGTALVLRGLAAGAELLIVRPVRFAWRVSRAITRVLVVAPARWVHVRVLAPIRASVRQARLAVMSTARQTGVTLRGPFRRAR